jgi:hypothetical protein
MRVAFAAVLAVPAATVLLSGADEIPYGVRGHTGVSYNVLSSSTLSLNAEWASVPPRFADHSSMADTVLRSVGVGLCGTMPTSFNFGTGEFEAIGASGLGEVARAQGFRLRHERYMCDLRSMACQWRDAAAAAAVSAMLALSLADSGTSRLRLSVGAADGPADEAAAAGYHEAALEVTVTRQARAIGHRWFRSHGAYHVMSTQVIVAPNVTIDCAALRQWRVARLACRAMALATRAGEAAAGDAV